MNYCYICGDKNASKPLVLKDSFTDHSLCQAPQSKNLCDRCYDCLDGKYKQCWYQKADGKVSKLWGRNWSWLVSEKESYPQFKEGKDGLLEVFNLPTRELTRKWIVNPPEPPFTICIAVSGQKHTYPFSQISYSQDLIPITFEKTIINWRKDDKFYLNLFEEFMSLGFSKTEIVSGDYSPIKLTSIDVDAFLAKDKYLAIVRNTSLMDLLSYIAIKPEVLPETQEINPKPIKQPAKVEVEDKKESAFTIESNGQLSLF
jgi:hypothetical protein